MITSDIYIAPHFCKFSTSPEAWNNTVTDIKVGVDSIFTETLPSGTKIDYIYPRVNPVDDNKRKNVTILKIY